MRKSLSACILVLSLAVHLTGCGTILYPERQGQTKGEIDPVVAILDGVGLIFLIVPGVVSFAIDFHTGAIYLPPGKTSRERIEELKGSDIRLQKKNRDLVFYFDGKDVTPEKIEKIVNDLTGIDFDLDNPELEVYKIERHAKYERLFNQFASKSDRSTLVMH